MDTLSVQLFQVQNPVLEVTWTSTVCVCVCVYAQTLVRIKSPSGSVILGCKRYIWP